MELVRNNISDIKTWLSVKSWELGISNFFINEIPFSWSNSDQFCQIVCDYLQLVLKRVDMPLIYDIGAGLGIGSKKYIQKLNLCTQAQVHIIDSSFSIIEQLKRDLSLINSNIKCRHMSFETLDKVPHFALMSYLFCSMPHQTIIWNGNQFKEEKKIVRFKGDLLDTSHIPPKIIVKDDIYHWIDEASDDVLLAHLKQIKDLIEVEDTILDPFYFDRKHDELFRDYFLKNDITYCKFNYSQSIIAQLIWCFENAPKTFMLFIQDVGYSIAYPDTLLTFDYGVCEFFTIYFPLIAHLASSYGLNLKMTSFPNGETQYLIIYKGIPCLDVSQIINFQTSFSDYEKSIKLKLQNWLHDTNQLMPLNLLDYNYSINVLIAKYFFMDKQGAQAIKYCLDCIDEYGDLAISSKLLLIQLYMSQNKLDLAYQLIQETIVIAPFVADLYLNLALLKIKQKNDDFLEEIFLYLKYESNIEFVFQTIQSYIIDFKFLHKNDEITMLYSNFSRLQSNVIGK